VGNDDPVTTSLARPTDSVTLAARFWRCECPFSKLEAERLAALEVRSNLTGTGAGEPAAPVARAVPLARVANGLKS